MSETIPFEPPEPSELSELLNGYQVTSLIASGGMGAVYKAIQLSLDRFVAIKLLPAELGADPSFRDQFQAEARSMAKLNHANLIGIYDFGEAKGMPYIVMEFVAGKSLYYSSYGKAIDQSTAVELIISICRGLAHAHHAGIIHRDVKPANILLDASAQPKIGDFGLAAAADSDEEDGLVYGTPGYAAPEILSNPKAIGVPSDVFAVGVILYELLTGKMPEEPPSPPSSVAGCDKRLDPIFKKASRRNPALRYQDAGEMADHLQEILPNLGRTRQRTVRTDSGAGSQKSVTLRRRTNNNGDRDTSGKPKLVSLDTRNGASGNKLKPLSDLPSGSSAASTTPSPAAVAMSTGSNWPIIRNLIIIGILIPIIVFTYGIYQEKEATRKTKEEDRRIEQKKEQKEQDAIIEKVNRDDAEQARLKAERAVREIELEKERQRLIDIEEAKPPLERLAEYRTALFNGRRDRFPDKTIDRSTHFLFFVKTPMTWGAAAEFAEIHGGHLATPSTQGDIDVLAQRMDEDMRRIWVGGGARGRGDWAWINGDEWIFKNPGTILGSCASLNSSGVIKARPHAEKNPFVIQWSIDGQNPGSISSQLERLVPTLDTPSPDWPPSTVTHESRYFLLVQKPLSWQEAEITAASAKGHLAVISEPQEGSFLKNFFKSSLLPGQSVWLGGDRRNDTWTWTTGEPWTKASWAPNSPNDTPGNTALRYIKSQDGAGWDNANPRIGNADGFIIEWSPDSTRKTTTTTAEISNPIAQFTKSRKIARRLAQKEIADYKKFLSGNLDSFLVDAKVWYRVLPKSQQALFKDGYLSLEDNLPRDGDLSGSVKPPNLPAELDKYLTKAIIRQDRREKQLNEKLEVLRQRYLQELVRLRSNFEENGLKSQMETIDSEIASVGQTAESFRSALGE